MDIEAVRRYCLSFPHATEDIQWQSVLLFRIAGKIFVTIALENTPTGICFKCTPEDFADLVEREGVIPAPYLARNHWVLVERLDGVPRAELKRLIKDSYDMIAAKLPKRTKRELGLA